MSRMSLPELESALWGAAQLLRGKINATGYKEYVFPLVFFKRISDVHEEEYRRALELSGGDEDFARQDDNFTFRIPPGCLWDDVRAVSENVGQALVAAWTRIERANPDRSVGGRTVEGLGGIFGKRDHWTNKNVLGDATLSALVEHFSALDLSLASCPADEMGRAYEYLVGKFADDAGNTAQEFYTNRTVVELMTEILGPRAGESIYDPTCGTGGMLISCIARCKRDDGNWREIRAFGQEQNALTASVARMNLFLHGVEEFRIVNDDTLLRPGFLDAGRLRTFDVVLANPPYSIKKWNREFFANDPYGRNFLGTPPQGRADYAFIQHILKSMDPKTGRCAILLPHGVLFREEEKLIRKSLIENDLVEAVIGLAPNLFYNSPMEACVVVCRMNKPALAKGRILFINAVSEVTRKNAESKLEPQHIAKVLGAYRERMSDGRFAYDATIGEIAAKDWSLAISLYAHASSVPSSAMSGRERDISVLIGDFAESESQAAKSLESLANSFGTSFSAPTASLHLCDANLPHGDRKGRRVKLGDVADEIRENWNGETKDVPIVGLEHLEPDEIWLRKWEVNSTNSTFTKAFRKGQLLFGRRRAYQKKLSLASCDGICSGDITVIAAKCERVLPELLPFILRTDKFFDFAIQGSAGSLSPRVKWAHLASYEFTLPPIEHQRELADLLWAANDLKESYRKSIAATDEMIKAKFREMFGEIKDDEMPDEPTRLRIEWRSLSDLTSIVTGKKDVNFGNASGRYPFFTCAKDVTRCDSYSFDCAAILVAGNGDINNIHRFTGKFEAYQRTYVIQIQNESLIQIGFLEYLLRTFWTNDTKRKMIGSTIPYIKLGMLADYRVPLPPLSLQREFVAIAEKADETKAALKKSIADLDQVMRGLIKE